MDENEKLLANVEQKAAEAVKNEIASFKDGMKDYAKAEDITKRFNTLEEQVKQLGVPELVKSIGEMREDVTKVATDLKKSEERAIKNDGGMTLKDMIRQELTTVKDQLSAFKNTDRKDVGMILTVKDAIISARADVSGNTMANRVSGIGQLQRRQSFMRNLFSQGSISADNHGVIRYTDQATLVSGAANIAEKGAFPNTSALTWIERNLNVEKIGDSIKLSREMMNDVEYVTSEIQNFLMRNIELVVDAQLLSGDGNTPNLKGLATSATAFVADAEFVDLIEDASYYDLISIVAAQIMYGTSYVPNGVLMNPYNAVTMKLKKDSLGNYIMPPFSVMTQTGIVNVDGVSIVTNSGVAKNTMYVGDFSRGTVYSNDALQLEFGYENTDFTQDLVTLKGRERLALLIRNVDAGAFTKVTDIAAAIESITKPI